VLRFQGQSPLILVAIAPEDRRGCSAAVPCAMTDADSDFLTLTRIEISTGTRGGLPWSYWQWRWARSSPSVLRGRLS